MGIAFKDLIPSSEIEIKQLSNKILIFDAFNVLYQFLTTIRGQDGSLLTDSKGQVTSHLVGLFSRATNFLDCQIKPIFVFDGVPPDLKLKTRQLRREIKEDAEQKFQTAKKQENIQDMKKFAARTTILNKELIDEAKLLLQALGIPVVQAPSEGEAQAAYMASLNHGYAVVSQDYDSLIHRAPKLIRNLSIAGKRKVNKVFGHTIVKPEIINLPEVLNNLQIDHTQLINLSMLIGTDYNPGGIKGIGPKNAIKLVKQYKDQEKLFSHVNWKDFCEPTWQEVYDTIVNMKTTDDFQINWEKPNSEKLKELLVDKHDFSQDRVDSSLKKITGHVKNQSTLADF